MVKKINREELYQAIKDLNVVDLELLNKSLALAQEKNLDFEEYLTSKDIIPEKNLAMLKADLLGIPFVDLQYKPIDPKIREIIPLEVAKKNLAVSFAKDNGKLSIAVFSLDYLDQDLLNFLHKKTGLEVETYLASKTDLENIFNLYIQEKTDEFDEVLKKALAEDVNSQPNLESPPIIELVNKIIDFASKNKASDIHIEPEDDKALVRYRIDGILEDILQIPLEVFLKVVMRLKIMAHLKTDEHQAAQDGKIEFDVKDESLDIRISMVPITNGEKVVMRLLSEKSRKFSLTDLGIGENDLEKIKEAYQNSHGMILNTGPTGSGKTTSLYSILKILNKRDINIMTIEDPVEYEMEGINQIQVNTKTNLTFADGLRSIVRQDPDVILVGEIRDNETADIAINSAMTGHLVLSTLHTNDAATSLPRLIDMKIEPFLISSTLKVIIAQRLVRRICQNCRVSGTVKRSSIDQSISEDSIDKLFGDKKEIDLYLGKGCDLCHQTGYKDRIGIFEIMVIDEDIREAIMLEKNASEIKQIAVKNGMSTMTDDGIDKVKKGITTLEEVLRVIKE